MNPVTLCGFTVKSMKKGKVKSTASAKGKAPRSKSVPASVCTNREEDLPAIFTQQTVSVEKENITKGDKQDMLTEAEGKI